MSPESAGAGFKVLALDDVLYGPVALPTLADWIKDERVQAESWVLCVQTQRWQRAHSIPELRPMFPEAPPADAQATAIRPGVLRRVKALGELDDTQLQVVAKFAEVVRFGAFTPVFRVGETGDAFFFVLEGEVRQRILVNGKELLIGIQEAGGVFGQISMFDGGPRVTEAVTDTGVVLLKLTSLAFRRLCRLHPEIGNIILLALGRTLAARIRSDDKHLCEVMAMGRSVR
jgi:CRP-like cAMP-binding protein